MTEHAVSETSASSLSVDIVGLSQKPGASWTPDEFEHYIEQQYEPQRYKQLIAVGRSRLGTKEEAEDAWGTFVTDKIADAVMKFDPAAHRTIDTWISYKFERFCQDIFRKHHARQTKLETNAQIVIEIFNHDQNISLRDVSEARDFIQSIIERLSDDERQLFILRFVEERLVREIADELNIAEGTVKSRLSALRSRLILIARDLEQSSKLHLLGRAQ